MLFKKNQPKKKHPILTLLVGTLASVGAISIINAGKQFCMDSMRKFAAMFKKDKHEMEECMDELSDAMSS